MTDIELLDEFARRGSREALGEMVRRHVGWVNAIARRRVGDLGLAEDVTQAAFLVLAERPPRVSDERALAGWLFTVVSNACRRAIRDQMRRKKREKAFAMEHPEAADNSAEMSEREWAELSPHLDEAVRAMSREDREAILLRFYQQKSHADVAAALGVSEDAARKRVQRAVGRLREILGARGVHAPAVAVLMGGLVEHAVPEASAAIVQSVLAATQGVAASAQGSSIANGVMLMMTAKKATAAAGVCLMALLVGGGATIMVLESRRHSAPVVATTLPSAQEGGEVYIGGNVQRSGVYSLGARLITLRSLIVAAGIEDPAGGERFVSLARKGSDGKPYYPLAPLALSDLMSQSALDVPLQPGDEIHVGNTRPTTLPATAMGWRERFDLVYRLNDGELLKLIPPPYIPERMTFYTETMRQQADMIPSGPRSFTFHWSNDGTLSRWGGSFSSRPQRVSGVVQFVLSFKTYEVEAPADFMQFEIDGDWILRQAATPEARLHALAGMVRQMGGPLLRFEQQLLPRKSIVVNGTFAYQPIPQQPARESALIHFYHEEAELENMSGAGGGGSGTVREMFEQLGSQLSLPLVDQRPEPGDARVSYYYHRTSRIRSLPDGPERDQAIRTLLDNIEKQTSLKLSIEQRPAQVWVGLPEAGL